MGEVSKPWRDKSRLYELYHGKGYDKKRIGDEMGCSDVTVGNWMDRLGVPDSRPYEFPQFLKTLYVDERMSQPEIAERLGCDQTTIGRALRCTDARIRDAGDYHEPSIYFSETGYLTCRRRVNGERYAFRIHRLVAVAEYGYDAVVGNDVHHKNGHPADNRPENLELIERSEHAELHHEREDILENYPS